MAAMEIRVKVADLRREAYDPQWVYINRIGNKTRLLSAADAIHNGGTIRNAIKVTWNPDRYAFEQISRYVAHRLRLIEREAMHGTCHQAIRCRDINTVLAGGCEGNAVWNKGAAILHTPTAKWAAAQAAKIA